MPGFDDIKNANTTTSTSNTEANKPKRDNDAVKTAREDATGTFNSIMKTAGRRFLNTQSNQYLDSVEKGIRETLEDYIELKDILTIVKIGSASLRYPAVAVCQKFMAKGVETISYFMFPVQDRSQPLERKGGSSDRNGRKDVPPVPTDVIDSKFYATAEQLIRDAFKVGDSAEVHCAGVQILGELFKLDQKEYPEGYVKLLYAAAGQTDAVRLKLIGDTSGIIQASKVESDTVLVGRIDYSPSINEDAAGNPIRSDINLTIREEKRRSRGDRGRDRDDSYNGDVGLNQQIIGIDASINFIFTDNDEDDRSRGRNDEYPQKFMPEIRITNIDNRLNPSIANMMYAISHIAALAQGDRWVNAFAPNLIRNSPGRNLGGLYAEQPEKDDPCEPVDLSDGTVDDVYDMAKRCCQKDVIVTLMASESSENSRLFDMFYVMASSSINSPEYLEIYDELMNEFKVMLGRDLDWNERDPIFAGDQLHRNLIGYYPLDNHIMSTEDVDYNSIVNTGRGIKPLVTAQEWDGSFGVSDYDEGTTTRARIIMEETDGMAKFTGAQTTLTINMDFLNTLNKALIEVGLGIEVEDNSGSDRRVRRPSSSFSGFAGRGEGYGRRGRDRDRGRDSRSGRSRNRR